MKNDAVFSKCKKYRYALWRTWDSTRPYAMFIGLNPTAADAINNNPTINRCIGFAKSWGYGGLCLTNLFAYLSAQPTGLRVAKDPIGPDNDQWLAKLAKDAGIIIAAWGNDGCLFDRSQVVATSIPNLQCLKINKSGEPAHPLYQPGSAHPLPFVHQSQK